MTTVLKLGGSVVTEKDRPETVAEERLDRCAAAIEGTGDLVVVHGGGSFGHHHASRHGVTAAAGSHDAAAAVDIHGAMKRLNDAVVAALGRHGVPAVPVHPFSAGTRDADGALEFPHGQVETMLGEGFVPVAHGDIVSHAGEGVTILSGDELVAHLAAALAADRVGLCSGVPGVLDADGEVIDRIDAVDEVAGALGDSDATDVTGGMAGKVRTLLELPVGASIFGPDDLAAFLAGGTPGTLVAGDG
ncbi:acetylglutamate kinase [Halobacteriales archaeon QS_1_68_17]|nr:MAG: acetylglutamate kinase [Halobacteriales archaeon QS_1_68_17]